MTSLRSGVKLGLMQQINELFGVKIFDNIKKYIKSKSNKSSLHSFVQFYKYQKKVYSNDEINLSGGKKPMKFLKNNILRGCNVRIDNNNKIIEIKSSNEYSSKGTAFKNLILKYQYSLNKNIVKHFNLPESLFINKYFKNDFHVLSSTQYKFELKKIPILLTTNMEFFPEVMRVHLDLSLVVEKTWKKYQIKDLGFVEVNNLKDIENMKVNKNLKPYF